MSETIRSELSKKNLHYISKHRYYELKHFVMQYPEWKKNLKEIDGYYSGGIVALFDKNVKKPTEEEAEKREYYRVRMQMVDHCLIEAFDIFSVESKTNGYTKSILEAVTSGWSYDILSTRYEVPFGREYYYNRIHKFYWLLDKERK